MPAGKTDFLLFEADEATAAGVAERLQTRGFTLVSESDPSSWSLTSCSHLPEVLICGCEGGGASMGRICREVKLARPDTEIFGYVGSAVSEDVRIPFLEAGADDLLAVADLVQMLGATRTPLQSQRYPESTESLGPALAMRVADGELPYIVQFLANGGRSGTLVLNFQNSAAVGTVAIADGRVRHAECGQKKGIEAIVDLMFHGEAVAEFHEGGAEGEPSISLPLDKMLLTVAWMFDEEAARRRTEIA